MQLVPFLQEASEFRHHSHHPKVVAAEELTVLWKNVQFSSGPSELRLVNPVGCKRSLRKLVMLF